MPLRVQLFSAGSQQFSTGSPELNWQWPLNIRLWVLNDFKLEKHILVIIAQTVFWVKPVAKFLRPPTEVEPEIPIWMHFSPIFSKITLYIDYPIMCHFYKNQSPEPPIPNLIPQNQLTLWKGQRFGSVTVNSIIYGIDN